MKTRQNKNEAIFGKLGIRNKFERLTKQLCDGYQNNKTQIYAEQVALSKETTRKTVLLRYKIVQMAAEVIEQNTFQNE